MEDLKQRQIWSEPSPLEEWERNRLSREAHFKRLQARAHAAVHKAVTRGVLLKLPHPHVRCVWCGRPARVYEHRDYRKPLDVRAACQRCNLEHGPAKDGRWRQLPPPIEGFDRLEDITAELVEVVGYLLRTSSEQESCQSYTALAPLRDTFSSAIR